MHHYLDQTHTYPSSWLHASVTELVMIKAMNVSRNSDAGNFTTATAAQCYWLTDCVIYIRQQDCSVQLCRSDADLYRPWHLTIWVWAVLSFLATLLYARPKCSNWCVAGSPPTQLMNIDRRELSCWASQCTWEMQTQSINASFIETQLNKHHTAGCTKLTPQNL